MNLSNSLEATQDRTTSVESGALCDVNYEMHPLRAELLRVARYAAVPKVDGGR